MITKQEKEALRPSHVVAMMQIGQRYMLKDFAQKLRRTENPLRTLLHSMVDEGSILVTVQGHTKYYELPEDEEAAAQIVPGRYVPEWKELGVVDMSQHQRQCEGARNPLTGVV